eukprot:jgi/Undpi1/6540/HiC_scaffold_20.g09019.m1
MKLFRVLLAGAATLLGVSAGTCPADEPEMINKDNLELQEEVYEGTIDTLDPTTDSSTAAAAAIQQISPSSLALNTCDFFHPGISVSLTKSSDSSTAVAAAIQQDSSSSPAPDACDFFHWGISKEQLQNMDGEKEESFSEHYDVPNDVEEGRSVGVPLDKTPVGNDGSVKGILEVVKLSVGTQVRAVSVNAFLVFNSKESWTFTAPDREVRDVWIDALVHTIDESATLNDEGIRSSRVSTTSMSDVLELKTTFRGMQPRKVTLTGTTFVMCKLNKGGKDTKACKWTFDAGSPENRLKWIHLIKGAVPKTKDNDEVDASSSPGYTDSYSSDVALVPSTTAPCHACVNEPPSASPTTPYACGNDPPSASSTNPYQLRADPRASSKARDKARSPPEPMYSDSRGWKLGPDDDPLVPGEHLSNLWLHKPTTMEVTEIGDVLLSPGFTPDREQDPLWAHRVMGAFGGRANGGFFCALENWLQRQINGEELQVKLTVKNGRWRVGRGAMCTLGKSPAPEGSLRRFLPWDERGQAIRAASLYLLQDDSAIIAYEQHLFWYSKTA